MGRKGKRKLVTGQRRRGRVNVMGGVRYHDRKRICFFIDKGNGDSFYEQLERLNEWVHVTFEAHCLGEQAIEISTTMRKHLGQIFLFPLRT